jgi:putative transposase
MTNIFTTTEKGCVKFWNERIEKDLEKLSKRSGNPAKPSDFQYWGGLDSNHSDFPECNWFNIIERKGSYANTYSMKIPTDKFQRESDNDEEEYIKTEKVKLLFNEDQKTKIRKWFGVCRYVYNLCVNELNKYTILRASLSEKEKKLKVNKMSDQKLRELVIGTKDHKPLPSWAYEVPADTRNDAVRDAWKAYQAVITKRVNGEYCELHFRKKKDKQSITIARPNFRKGTFYPTIMGKVKVKSTGRGATTINSDGDARISYSRFNGYILHKVIKYKAKASENQGHTVIALDPGVRTFMTAYEPNKTADIGNGAVIRIARLKNAQRNLLTKMKSVNAKKRKGMKKAYHKLGRKIQNLTDEMHWKTIRYIMKYDDIILPNFAVKGMTKRSNPALGRIRKISKKTVSNMLLLQHYKFKMRLINKVKVSIDNRLFIVNESYTSKTCSSCGHEHIKLGSLKQFDCPNCSMSLDRDVNGARNIFMKYVHFN